MLSTLYKFKNSKILFSPHRTTAATTSNAVAPALSSASQGGTDLEVSSQAPRNNPKAMHNSPPPNNKNETNSAKTVHHCQFCRKGFRFTTNWRAHERTHTGEKLFLCEWAGCHKRFAHPASLQAHIAKHQGIKPCACTQPGCTQKFANKSNLNRHMRRIHHLNTKGQKLSAVVVAKMKKKN